MVVIINSIRNIFGDTSSVSKMSFLAAFPLLAYILGVNKVVDTFFLQILYFLILLCYLGFFVYVIHATLNDENEYMMTLNPLLLISRGVFAFLLIVPVGVVSFIILKALHGMIYMLFMSQETAWYVTSLLAFLPFSLIFTILILYAKDFKIVDGFKYEIILKYFHNLIFHIISQILVILILDGLYYGVVQYGIIPLIKSFASDSVAVTSTYCFFGSFLIVMNLGIVANFIGELGWGLIYGESDDY